MELTKHKEHSELTKHTENSEHEGGWAGGEGTEVAPLRTNYRIFCQGITPTQ